MKQAKSISEIFDTLLILLNCSACYSVIPYILFHQYNRGVFVIIIAAINILYLCYKYGFKTELPSAPLFILYFLINIWNSYASLYTDSGYLLCTAYLIANSTFFIILYNCYITYLNSYSTRRSLWLVIRGYVYLEIICILSALLTFIVLKMGYPLSNNINDSFDLFTDNVVSLGHNYYAPLGVGIVLDSLFSSLRLFSEDGIICGLYHEPHIITFMVFPSLFFLWAYAKNNYQKLAIFLSGLFIAILASSTTNIIVTFICLCIALFFLKKGKIFLIPVILSTIFIVIFIGLENTELFFVAEKLDNAGGSRDYSLRSLEFALYPKTWIGSNIINASYVKELGNGQRDMGIIMTIINLCFLIIVLYQTVKLIVSHDRFYCLIGVGCLYFIMHSAKTASTSYSFSVLLLIIFIISYSLKSRITLLGNDEQNYKTIEE